MSEWRYNQSSSSRYGSKLRNYYDLFEATTIFVRRWKEIKAHERREAQYFQFNVFYKSLLTFTKFTQQSDLIANGLVFSLPETSRNQFRTEKMNLKLEQGKSQNENRSKVDHNERYLTDPNSELQQLIKVVSVGHVRYQRREVKTSALYSLTLDDLNFVYFVSSFFEFS